MCPSTSWSVRPHRPSCHKQFWCNIWRFFLLKAHYVVFGKKFYSEEKKSLLTDFFSFFFALNKYIPASFSWLNRQTNLKKTTAGGPRHLSSIKLSSGDLINSVMGKKKYVWVSIITSFIPSFDIDMTCIYIFFSIFTHGHIIFSGNLHIFFHSFVFHSDPLKKKCVLVYVHGWL